MELTITKGFTQKTCGECGVIHWIPDELEAERKKTGKSWYCPSGHIRAYIESEADKYRRLYLDAERYRTNAVQENSRLSYELAKCNKAKAKKAVKK